MMDTVILCSDEFCLREAKWRVVTPNGLLYLCDEHVRKYRDLHDKMFARVNFSVRKIKEVMPKEEVTCE